MALFNNVMITIVLVRPQHPGNVGAVARVMANFGFHSLMLIAPKCDHREQEARNRAKHAQSILQKAKVRDFSALKRFDYVLGTSAQTGTAFNIPRSPVSLKEAARSVNRKAKIALLFGSEGTGLTNEEVDYCDFLITIPASKKYGTLNVSHAVSIVLYEFFATTAFPVHPLAEKKDMQTIAHFFDKVLDSLPFTTEQKRETQKKVWRKIIAKAMLTKRETFAVMGFLRKLL
ncbi:TrmJ/YjtD family RNA methyltransferase [Candidatus Woesearchaeota archaeon]|nr:TrmJ/YjtD family RNA methyltransferase [Candidatus Woesearchaeota archaeon]